MASLSLLLTSFVAPDSHAQISMAPNVGTNAASLSTAYSPSSAAPVGVCPSLQLDGIAARAEAAAALDLNIVGDWSVEAWFKDEDPNGFDHDYRQILMKGDRNADPGAPYFVLVGFNHLLAGVRTGGLNVVGVPRSHPRPNSWNPNDHAGSRPVVVSLPDHVLLPSLHADA